MDSQLLLHLPYNLHNLRTGYSDTKRLTIENSEYLSYVGGEVRLFQVATDYGASYSSQVDPSLLHYRDYLISLSLFYCLENCLYYDPDNKILTGHAEKAFARYGLETFYPYSLDGSRPNQSRFVGLLGSLAYYFLYVEALDYPLDYIEELLTYIWFSQGSDYNLSPNDRINQILDKSGRQTIFDSAIPESLDALLSITNSNNSNYNLMLQAKRSFLDTTNGNDFIANVLAGTYNSLLPTIATAVLTNTTTSAAISNFTNNILSIAKPTGFPLLVQALIVEGLIKAAKVINNLTTLQASESKTTFLNRFDPEVESIKLQVAENLALSVDALSYLKQKNIRSSSAVTEDLDDTLNSVYQWTPTIISGSGINRLSSLIDTPDYSSRSTPQGLSPFLTELSQRPSNGSITLNSSSNSSDQISYVAVDFSSSQPPTLSFLTPDGTPPTVRVISSQRGTITAIDATNLLNNPRTASGFISNNTNTNNSLGDSLGVVVAEVNLQEPIAVVALSGTNNNNFDSLSPESLPPITSVRDASKEASSADTSSISSSNVLVSTPNNSSSTLSRLYGRRFTIVQGQYTSYSEINTNDLPRGGAAEAYSILNLGQPVLTKAQTREFFEAKIEGSIEDYNSRMTGLVESLSNVHIKEEVQTINSWLTDLPIGSHSGETNLDSSW